MTRRLATLALAVLIALANLAVCPRAEASCLAMRDQAHDCCAKSDALAPAKCCCSTSPAAHSPSELGSVAPNKHDLALDQLADGIDLITAPALAGGASLSTPLGARRAPPPRGPLLSQFTSLLL